MENKDKEELLIEIAVVEKLVKENPCNMKAGIFHALKDVVRSSVSRWLSIWSVMCERFPIGGKNTMIFLNLRKILPKTKHITGLM